eukprot:1196201-Prorocentrum_minimum.AAC.4
MERLEMADIPFIKSDLLRGESRAKASSCWKVLSREDRRKRLHTWRLRWCAMKHTLPITTLSTFKKP